MKCPKNKPTPTIQQPLKSLKPDESTDRRFPLTQRLPALPKESPPSTLKVSMHSSDEGTPKRTARACDSCYKRKV